MKRNALLSRSYVSAGAYTLAVVIVALALRLGAPNIFWQIFAPVFAGANTVALTSHTFLSSFGDRSALALDNERLANENTILASENQTLIQNAASQQALLGLSAGQNTKGIIAGVVLRPPTSPYDTLVVASGKSAGIANGMEAFGPGGVPLGIVSAVAAGYARVTLFSSPGMSADGWAGSAKVPITIRGAGAGALSATVSRDAAISVGDDVFAPGPGLHPVGRVVRIDSDASSPSVTLQIQPAINLFSVAWVELHSVDPSFTASIFSSTSTVPSSI